MIAGDRVSVTVTVAVPPDRAFAVFTEEIDQWWRRGIRYRVAGRRPGTLAFEPKLGGRLFEQYESSQGPRTHEAGTITAWQPGVHLAFDWRGSNFAPGEVTHVDVRFTATDSGGTRVELVHSGFASLRPDHPVRHGEPPLQFTSKLGGWWADLLTALRIHVEP